MYIAQQAEEGADQFAIYSPQDVQDVNGDTVTILGNYELVTVDNLNFQIQDLQEKLDAITALQGGADPVKQFSDNKAKIQIELNKVIN